MAAPTPYWNLWSQASIEPMMEAVIHFPSGDVTLYDNDIVNLSLVVPLFDSSYILFGPPDPGTGVLEIQDFDQTYNPTRNSELTSGTQVDFYLGIVPSNLQEALGNNIVTSWSNAQQVLYNGQVAWAVIFNTSVPLQPLNKYYLYYQYTVDGSEELLSETMIVPGHWFAQSIYAIVHTQQVNVLDLQICEINTYLQHYGQFYTQEWSYDSHTHTTTVNLIDNLGSALTLDSRADAPLPALNASLNTALYSLISLYQTPYIFSPALTVSVPYLCYYGTQASTIQNMLVALGANYCFLPDGSSVICDSSGAYDTNITLTDEDIEQYDIAQTSALNYDSISVNAQIPFLSSKQLLLYENMHLTTNEVLPFTMDGIFRVTSVVFEQTNRYTYPKCTWDPYGLTWLDTEDYASFKIYGDAIESTPQSVVSEVGVSPYVIDKNMYIQTTVHAQQLVNLIDTFYSTLYNTVTITLRGCPGFWAGAIVHLTSSLYNIDADYVIINLEFTYNGAVHTTATLQRIV